MTDFRGRWVKLTTFSTERGTNKHPWVLGFHGARRVDHWTSAKACQWINMILRTPQSLLACQIPRSYKISSGNDTVTIAGNGVDHNDKATTQMPSTFLQLPRELRDLIYAHTLTVAAISALDTRERDNTDLRKGWHPALDLEGAPTLNLLLVCKQIHDEYRGSANSTMTLWVDLHTSDVFSAGELKLEDTFPRSLLGNIKQCQVTLSWLHLSTILGQYDTWISDARQQTPQGLVELQGRPSTPAKSLRDAISRILGILSNVMHSGAEVDIEFTLDCLSESTCETSLDRYDIDDRLRSFHAPSIAAMAQDSSMAWPVPGKLRMHFRCWTPLYCTESCRPQQHQDQHEIPVAPPNRGGGGRILWQLSPTNEENAWHGFWPEMFATLDETWFNWCQ